MSKLIHEAMYGAPEFDQLPELHGFKPHEVWLLDTSLLTDEQLIKRGILLKLLPEAVAVGLVHVNKSDPDNPVYTIVDMTWVNLDAEHNRTTQHKFTKDFFGSNEVIEFSGRWAVNGWLVIFKLT